MFPLSVHSRLGRMLHFRWARLRCEVTCGRLWVRRLALIGRVSGPLGLEAVTMDPARQGRACLCPRRAEKLWPINGLRPVIASSSNDCLRLRTLINLFAPGQFLSFSRPCFGPRFLHCAAAAKLQNRPALRAPVHALPPRIAFLGYLKPPITEGLASPPQQPWTSSSRSQTSSSSTLSTQPFSPPRHPLLPVIRPYPASERSLPAMPYRMQPGSTSPRRNSSP